MSFGSDEALTTAPPSKKAQAILDRLARLEESQHDMMKRMRNSHDQQMSQLRKQLEEAKDRCLAVTQGQLIEVQPVLMQVDMTEVEAAVQAASFAEQESAIALEEARQVAHRSRMASHSLCDVVREGDLDNDSANKEYIVKKVSVNLDEVERVVGNCAVVSVCRAFGLPDPKYGNEVYCAVKLKENVKVSEPMLVMHAQKHLPTASVPKRFHIMSELPAGITRKALADTYLAGDFEKKTLPFLGQTRKLIEN